LELPKLPEEWKTSSDDRLLWAKFISSERKEDFEMLATKNTYLESAYQQLQIISQDKEKRLEYEARQKSILDYNQSIWEAEQRGRETGERIGREAGREEGKEIGRKAGEQRINELNAILIRNKRYDDLERSINDIHFQHQLMKEYGI